LTDTAPVAIGGYRIFARTSIHGHRVVKLEIFIQP